MKKKRGQYIGRKKGSRDEASVRNAAGYAEKMKGNAYFEQDVWVIVAEDLGEDDIAVMGLEPDGKGFGLLLAYTSRAKAEVYRDGQIATAETFGVKKMPLGVLVMLAMAGQVGNIAIDRLDDISSYEMLDVIRMKTQFDAGLRLDE